jgi:hypothetical protein
MPLTTYTAGEVLTAASLNDNFLVGGAQVVTASTAFTTSAAVNVNNVFTTNFSGYRVSIDVTARSTTLQMLLRLRVGGVDTSSAYYGALVAGDYASAANTFGPRSNNATSLAISNNNASSNSFIRLDIMFPALARNTSIEGMYADGSGAYVYRVGGFQTASTAFDGFSLITSTGTISGTYSIVGYTL